MSKRVPFWSFSREAVREGWQARKLGGRDRDEALECLRRCPRENLFLLDLTANLGGPPSPGEPAAELFGAWRNGRLQGVAALRPSVSLDASLSADAVDALFVHLSSLRGGLVKSTVDVVETFWSRMSAVGRRALVDRMETACAVTPDEVNLVPPAPGWVTRVGRIEDLPALVAAARASLREEGRPDPYDGDPEGFRRWVRGRVSRATLVEVSGQVAFVGNADVQRPEGCLVQGVYTWPRFRRQGLASAGVSELCRTAFGAGADHVQLAVIEGNAPAERLYSKLGFRPFARLRTILFG